MFPAAQVPAPAADFKELHRLRAAEGDETVGNLSSGKHRDRSRSLAAGVGGGAEAGWSVALLDDGGAGGPHRSGGCVADRVDAVVLVTCNIIWRTLLV